MGLRSQPDSDYTGTWSPFGGGRVRPRSPQDAPYFTGAERVALELVEAGLTPNPFGERVPDDLFEKASAHYDDKALWTLTLAIGQICFFIPVALIAKPIPGESSGKHYRK